MRALALVAYKRAEFHAYRVEAEARLLGTIRAHPVRRHLAYLFQHTIRHALPFFAQNPRALKNGREKVRFCLLS